MERNDNFEKALDNAKSVMRQMDVSELKGEVSDLLLKYSEGTKVNELSVREFETLSNLITEIIRHPAKYIK